MKIFIVIPNIFYYSCYVKILIHENYDANSYLSNIYENLLNII